MSGLFVGRAGRYARPLLVVCASILVAASVPGGEAAPTRSGALVFVSTREGESGIYAINADGSGLRKLVENARDPAWSPDGRVLAFLRDVPDDEDYSTRLEVREVGGGGQSRPVGSHPYCCSAFSWSPDGKQIAYEAFGRGGIYVTNVDGSGERLVTLETAFNPAWSPDGSKIAFIERRDDDSLSVVNADGTNDRQLAADVSFSVRPVWSPDSSKILFGREICDENRCDETLSLVDSDGSHERSVTPVSTDDDYPAQWSPDGRLLAFVGLDENFHTNTFVVRPEGDGLKLVDKGGAGTSWSPDGRSLAVVRGPDIWTTAVDGSGRSRITQGGRYGYGNESPQWHPQGISSAQIGGRPVSPAIPTDSVATGALLRTRARTHRLAADGDRVAMAYDVGPNCFESWEPRRHRLTRLSENDDCGDDGESGLLEFTLTESRLGWLSYQQGTAFSMDVFTATLAHPLANAVLFRDVGGSSCLPRPSSTCAFIGDLHSARGSIFFDTWHCPGRQDVPSCAARAKVDGKLWRTRGKQAKAIRSSRGGLTVLAAGAERLAVLRRDGRLEVLGTDGHLQGIIDLRGVVRAAAIRGVQLVVLTQTRLLVYDALTRKLNHSWPLSRGGPSRKLAGTARGYATYVDGRTIKIVRLADGLSRRIEVPGNGAVEAALTSSGLFYAYALPNNEYRGRVAFVRLR
jgi:Tol biopolymer transport system component